MYQNFAYYNVKFEKKGTGSWVFATGEIRNNTGQNFHLAAFRMIVFDKNTLLWSGVIKIADLLRNQTRYFEIFLEGFDAKVLPSISRYEISLESAY